MTYTINNKKVSKKKAVEYLESLYGNGAEKLADREQEAREYFAEEADNWCSWADGFAISY